MKKKLLLIIGIILIIIIVGVSIYLNRAVTSDGDDFIEEEIMVQKVSEQTLDETLLVTGKIVPEDEQKIYADGEYGEIKQFKVEENATVKAGDPLFEYDGSQIESEFNAAVRARDMVQNSVKATEHQLAQFTKEIEELKKLEEDTKELELERDQLKLELENTKAEVENAQADINDIQKQKEALIVKSKIDGVVVSINKNSERTEDGSSEAVIHIVSNKPFKVIGSMSEFDTVKVKEEQNVIIRPKVFKDREWKGVVESVSEYPTDDGMGDMDMYAGDSNVTMYPFKVAITDDTTELRQGFHVSLEVSIGGDEKKLAVPHSALMEDGMGMDEFDMMDDMMIEDGNFSSGESYVYVLIDGLLERRDVEVGNMNDEYVEIKDGVKKDELVVINPNFDMYDGMEVTSYDEIE